jgi:hypothetical protein
MGYEGEELTRLYEYLSKRGITTSEDELLRVILEFAAEKEDELSLMLGRKKSEDILKRWLESLVEIEPTDSLNEHDSVM